MADTPPTLSSATLNKSAFSKGETMVITATGFDPDEETIEVTVQLRNKNSGVTSNSVTVTGIVDELEAVATSTGRTWTAGTRSGDTFTLTSVA